jgi:hypothetical protein
LKAAWASILKFVEQFQAAKKIQHFVNGANPMKKVNNMVKQGEDVMDSITSGTMCMSGIDPSKSSKVLALFRQSRNVLRACG